jgi:hypothetical protein
MARPLPALPAALRVLDGLVPSVDRIRKRVSMSYVI